MKEIKAIIKPFVLDKVLTALDAMGDLPGVTISEVTGWGRLTDRGKPREPGETGHGLAKRIKLEIVVSDERAEQVEQAVASAAHTGKPGDGKLFVYDVQRVLRIRTGETGTDAI